jgi:hypothetical protein
VTYAGPRGVGRHVRYLSDVRRGGASVKESVVTETLTQSRSMQNHITERRVMLEVHILNRSRTGTVILIRKRMTVAEAVRAARERNVPGRLFIQSGDVHQRAWWEKR